MKSNKVILNCITFLYLTLIVVSDMRCENLKSVEEDKSVNFKIVKDYLEKANNWIGVNYDSSLYYSKLAIKSAGKYKNLNKKLENELLAYRTDATILIGELFYKRGFIDSSLTYFSNSVSPLKILNKKDRLAEIYIVIGSCKEYQSNIVEALNNYEIAREIYTKINDTNGIALVLNNFGVLYYNQGDINKGISYITESLKIYKETNNFGKIIWTANNIGNMWLKIGKPDKAFEYFNYALSLSDTSEATSGLAYTLKNLGNYYLYKKMLDSALYYHKMDIQVYTELNEESGISLANTNVGNVYYEMGNYKLAQKHGEIAYNIAKNINLSMRVIEVSELLKKVYKKKLDYKNALFFTELWIQMKDSARNNETERATIRQQMKFEYEKKKAISDEQFKQKLLVAKEKENKQRIISYFIFAGLLSVVVIAVLIYRMFRMTNIQNKIVKEKNKDILDSITYAKRIQDAILPNQNTWNNTLKESFILYRPKDILAGDFYWFEKYKDSIYFAAADCTGHGVPGAMVSVVCATALTKVLLEEGVEDVGKILDRTREIVIEKLSKNNATVKDGMDISLCSIYNFTSGTECILEWAGANNPLWIIPKSGNPQLIEIKPDKQPIGKIDNPKPYTTHKIELKKDDIIYIFTDGFADQFGGEKGKKFMYKSLKNLLLSIQAKNMIEQKKIIEGVFDKWKGNLEQVDDVCIIGVRI